MSTAVDKVRLRINNTIGLAALVHLRKGVAAVDHSFKLWAERQVPSWQEP